MEMRKPQQEDYEYERKGPCCIFVAFEPHTGQRFIQERKRRTRVDYAQFMKELVEKYYPEAEGVRLVQDNLNTHSAGSFYEAFPPEETFALAQKFEYHYTPKKGSWLNMAEIELPVLAKRCLDRRIGYRGRLAQELGVSKEERTRMKATVRWRFTKKEARVKFHKFYHVVEN